MKIKVAKRGEHQNPRDFIAKARGIRNTQMKLKVKEAKGARKIESLIRKAQMEKREKRVSARQREFRGGLLIMGTGNERDTITCETVGEKFQSERDRRNKGKPKSIKAFFFLFF